MIDQIFNNLFSVLPYQFFEAVIGVLIIEEFLYNFFENWDML